MDLDNSPSSANAQPTPSERVWSEFLAVLDALPPRTRAAFMLHAMFGANCADIAPMLGLEVGDCRERIELAHRSAHHHARLLARIAGTP